MSVFKILWWLNIAILVIVLGGFLFYLCKGPVSPSITGAWLLVSGIGILLLLSAAGLNACHHTMLASLLLFIMGAPGIIYLFLMLAINIFGFKL